MTRLASSVLVSALIRRAEAEGGFAAVLARGDPNAGSILLVLSERGARCTVFERLLSHDGEYHWQSSDSDTAPEIVPALVARRRQFDPDLWVVELDIPSIERFAAEMISQA